jgi:hypothetical protein
VIALAFALAACGGGSKAVSKSAATADPETSIASGTTAGSSSAASGSARSDGAPQHRSSQRLIRFLPPGRLSRSAAAVGNPMKTGVPSSGQSPVGPVGGCLYDGTGSTQQAQSLVHAVFPGDKITRSEFDHHVNSQVVGAQAKPV